MYSGCMLNLRLGGYNGPVNKQFGYMIYSQRADPGNTQAPCGQRSGNGQQVIPEVVI
jgi:hypothetical protein